jgi:DNA-binding XRE family transcriptional regulator
MDSTPTTRTADEIEARRATFRKAIGQMVTDLRGNEDPPMNQDVLAARVGVSRGTIIRLESGKSPLGYDVLFEIFAVFGWVSDWTDMMHRVIEDDWRVKPTQ